MSALHTRQWRKVRAQVLSEESICYLCGKPIDHEAPPRSPRSPSVDHVTPLYDGGDPYDRGNLLAVHYGCNSGKQHRPAKPRRSAWDW